ncbi:hypothetical protein GDO86_005979 [Hymenochirus boettgeri]|uniref:Uncharacterized protein n=1 Tax=Hymenochirus boettgeri TaxID=247094 RepID=A0A8T2J6Q4_9PIPI|nr:hypothetical protein GDO86_005979 [Hymenochirus boettgeri]
MELFKKPKSQYSAQQRLFCVTLHLHDQSLYNYLRNEIRLPIPEPRQLRQWLKTDCHNTGINSSVLEALLRKRQQYPEMYKRTCLIVDSVAISQHISYDSEKNELVGFVNFGKGANASVSQEVANEALMFLLVGLDGYWKVPVACFFIRTLTAQAQHQLILDVLHELADNSFETVAITMERNPLNEETCILLGCNFNDSKNLQTHFTLPNSNKNHYIIFDVTKEQQILSDMVEKTGIMLSPEGPVIWQYITDLMSLNKTTVKRACGNHNVESQLMDVKLMINKLGGNVANALNMLEGLKCERFIGSSATASFIKIVDRIFSILTSKIPWGQGDRSPINHINLQQKLCILQETEEYFLSLTTCNNIFVHQSERRQNILGILVNITSLKALLPDLLFKQNYIATQKFSMNHLKILTNRNPGDREKRPTAIQVKRALGHLLSQCGLWNTSEKKELLKNEMCFPSLSISCSYLYLPSPFQEDCVTLPDHIYSSNILDVMLQNSDMYIAGWIVREAFTQLTCNECRWALVTGETPQDFRSAYHLLQVKDCRCYFIPSNGTINHYVLSSLGPSDIFNLKQHIVETDLVTDNHYFQLIRMITSIFYKFRKAYITKVTQARLYRAQVKQILSKPINN